MTKTEQTLALLNEMQVLRPRDLKERDLSPSMLYSLYRQEKVIHTGRGLYTLPDAELTENHSLVEACKRVPHGTICLLSALRYHNIGTQNPFAVWMAVDRKARRPQVDYPPLRIVRFSGPALTEGVETKQIEGVPVRLFSVAKTIADCFKDRNKIGLDVALKALRECIRVRCCTYQELCHRAKICRVSNVMRSYLEAMS